ncbi:MAG TPA: AAA family ATPase [Thermoanaerobaculaceae bacterium]|nr:AAA family ATPase [Thermoanaerobaculaceae bacterium]HRS17251.1 AAA family ATPase [Thermoanaerobaculaceae bacterium]
MATTVDQLRTALASAYPLTVILSPEEDRIEKLLLRFAAGIKPEALPMAMWNCLDGFPDRPGSTDPVTALRWVAEEAPRGFYLFKDLHAMLPGHRGLLRRLRDTAASVRNTGRFLFLLGPAIAVPDELKPLTYVVTSLFPDESEVSAVVSALLQQARRNVDADALQLLVGSLRGMSLLEVEGLLRRLLARHAALDDAFMAEVLAEKEQVMRKEGILEFVPPDRSLGELGGLDQLKLWVRQRSGLFTPQARAQGLPRPKGILLMGMSGCGKSLAIKVIATEWKLPLFRLDMNTVFAGVHGSAEWVFHRALEATEAVAPAVLWIDEIEMGVAGYHEGESGSLTRIFSTFLTWMQEHRADVFVAATANRINLLPAEIIRKGRFDQVFFVELPNEEERKEILSIHLRRQQLDAGKYDLVLLASATRGWNGAEIEQAVIAARIACHAERRPVEQRDLLHAMGQIVPLSTTMSEQIKAIRGWARTRAMAATSPSKQEM